METKSVSLATKLVTIAAKLLATDSTEKAVDSLVDILKTFCWQVLDYTGDKELISSCNDSYWMNNHNYILTDGAIHMNPTGVNSTYTIRGASYVIICEPFNNGKLRVSLRVDRSMLIESFRKIILTLADIPGLHDDMVYYITEHDGIKLLPAPQMKSKTEE